MTNNHLWLIIAGIIGPFLSRYVRRRTLTGVALASFLFAGCDRERQDPTGGNDVPHGITIERLSVRGPGVQMSYGLMNTPVTFNVDSAGEDRLWYFDDYSWDESFTVDYRDPQASPCPDQFPSATRFLEFTHYWGISGLIERVANDAVWDLGILLEDFCDTYYRSPRFLKLPCRFGTNWIDVHVDSTSVSGQWTADTTYYICDAWGTICTPCDTCDVLRLSEYWVEYLWTEPNPIPLLEFEDFSYFWFDEHGDVIVAVSATGEVGERGSDPCFDQGLIEIRTSVESLLR